ncbi:MAG: ATP-binding cassette domain-containing protein, partial [Dehalococcoidia bacterium]
VYDIWIQQKDLTGGGAGLFGITMPSLGGEPLGLKEYLYLLLGLNVVVFLMLRQLVDRSRWGRALLAVRDAEPAARAVGIHPFMVRESALALSAFLAGLAGALFPPLPGLINPESFPIIDSIFFLLAVLAGGMGTVAGPVVGTVVLFSLPQILAEQEGLRKYSFLVYGVLLLLLVIFLPEGMVGGIRRLWYSLLRRRGLLDAPAALRIVPEAGVPEPADLAAGPALAYMSRNGASPQEWALEAEEITIRFGDVVALREVTVRIRPETVHAIIGPNGSGKTTLLNVISGFYAQDKGQVRVFGRRFPRGASTRGIRYGMARTFQSQLVLPQLSVAENVMLGCHAWGRVGWLRGMLPLPAAWRERRRMRETALDCLDLVGLGRGVAELPCGQLPFAHQRLVEIARTLAGRPRILLLDEPASGLHADEVAAFVRLVRRLKAGGLTVVLVEHNFGLVSELADTITVLDAGVKLAEGDFDSVRHDGRVVEAYLGV